MTEVLTNQKRIDRALGAARGHWREIFESAGIDSSHLTGKGRPCPLCGGTDRFVFDDKFGAGNYFCRQCGAGNGFTLLSKYLGCGFWDALKFVENFCVLEPIYPTKLSKKNIKNKDEGAGVEEISPERKFLREMMDLWAKAVPVSPGDPVWKYLNNRGLQPETAGYEVRCHPSLPYVDDEGEKAVYPAMLSRVVDSDGCVVNLHRTYLTEDGMKAPVSCVKKLMPAKMLGACVRIGGMPTTVLGFAEGIETACAASQFSGFPVWASLGCTNMRQIDYVPEGVEKVIVFSDNDKNFAGQAAAYALAHALALKDLEVSVRVPEQTGTDWLDEITGRNKF